MNETRHSRNQPGGPGCIRGTAWRLMVEQEPRRLDLRGGLSIEGADKKPPKHATPTKAHTGQS